ncbi:3D domain-containing protein, partial [Schnuerera sp.]|uniref:3D domain-containing protein n=1 Tax=Schnuerera sp. TaxID=2794844 RepID=UPI002C645076
PNIEEMMKIDNEVTDEDMDNWESWSNWKTMKIKQEEERKAKEELERLEEEKMKKQSIKEETAIQNNNSNSSNSVVINQPSNESGYDLGNFNVSFYTAYCVGCSGITATGIDVRNTNYYNGMQVIATDPNVIPLYSIVELRFSNGNTVKAIAMDTGGAIKGNRIDYLVSSTNEAISNGRQTASVKIIRKGGD